jgi:hypothetical protein
MLLVSRIEGFNIADLGWGAASAKTVTASFWVRSSLTGTFGGSIRNNGATRSYPFAYSVSAADTWEYKTVTITGDTSGTWLTDNGVGLSLTFSLGAGPDRSGTPGAWISDNNISVSGEVSLVGTLDATWQVTGVQLEAGTVATPFEHRSFGQELALCQRYFVKPTYCIHGYSISGGGSDQFNALVYPVQMRASPTLTIGGQLDGGSFSSLTFDRGDAFGSRVFWTAGSGFASFAGYTASAEL